jgi:hypothetical protein
MAKAPNIDRIAAELSVLERVLLFCLASGTDYAKSRHPLSPPSPSFRPLNRLQRNITMELAVLGGALPASRQASLAGP